MVESDRRRQTGLLQKSYKFIGSKNTSAAAIRVDGNYFLATHVRGDQHQPPVNRPPRVSDSAGVIASLCSPTPPLRLTRKSDALCISKECWQHAEIKRHCKVARECHRMSRFSDIAYSTTTWLAGCIARLPLHCGLTATFSMFASGFALQKTVIRSEK